MLLIICYALFYVVNGLAFHKVFQKAGKKGWEAFVPVYNEITILKITEKPLWWIVFIFLPGFNLLFAFVVLIEMAKCFGKFSLWEQALAVIAGFLYFPYLGFSKQDQFLGPAYARTAFKRSPGREWVDAIIFAMVAATVIRSGYVEAYTIPTPSMEETLKVDDYLFVSKINYGARIPMTPLAFPLVHNTLPLIGGQSFLDWPSLPYYRIPGFEKIKNGDFVVFNGPADNPGYPVDKKENLIKRCIAIPGDSLQIVNREPFINNKMQGNPKDGQQLYRVVWANKEDYNDLCDEIAEYQHTKRMKKNGMLVRFKKLGIDANDSVLDFRSIDKDPATGEVDALKILMTENEAKELRAWAGIKSVQIITDPKEVPPTAVLFPGFPGMDWSKDYYGPIYIPKKGDHIAMTIKNYYTYQKAIREYEHNPSLTLVGNEVMLNGKPIKEYVMKMDYYFMMGDNRDNSEDSRYWGFVPEDHIVGKPVMIWLSLEHDVPWYKTVRWDRVFKVI